MNGTLTLRNGGTIVLGSSSGAISLDAMLFGSPPPTSRGRVGYLSLYDGDRVRRFRYERWPAPPLTRASIDKRRRHAKRPRGRR